MYSLEPTPEILSDSVNFATSIPSASQGNPPLTCFAETDFYLMPY